MLLLRVLTAMGMSQVELCRHARLSAKLRTLLVELSLISPRRRWAVQRAVRRAETPGERWRRQRCAHLAREYGRLG